MIKGVRLKFICVNMLIVTLMLCVIFGLTLNLTRSAMEEEGLVLLRTAVSQEKEKQSATPSDSGRKDKLPKPSDNTASTEPTASKNSGMADNEEHHGTAPAKKQERRENSTLRLPTFTLQYSKTGELQAQGSDFYDLTDSAYLKQILDEAKATGEEYGVMKSYELRFLRTRQNGVDVFVFADISSETSTMQNLIVDMLIISAIAFVAFLIISIFLSRWAVTPVERAWDQQQQFIADASHELKTPLTVILTNAELMWDNELEAEEQRQCVGNVLDMSRRMRSLTEEMLHLARAESAQKELMDQQCDLHRIVDDAVLAFEVLFYEQGLELEADIAQDLKVKGNETQLRMMVEILLDNARKYSLPGQVQLSLKKHNSRSCILSLSNPSEPITQEELKHLFERFYRVDKARSSDGSFGLGLSIAEGIVHRHRGTISASCAEGRLTFTIQLPTA